MILMTADNTQEHFYFKDSPPKREAQCKVTSNRSTAMSKTLRVEDMRIYPNTSGAPNDQFVVKCIIIPQLMKINVIKAFSGVFQCCWENIICSFFPSKTHKKFPSQLDKIGWFPSQLIKFISQPGIPRAFESLDPKRPNKSDKTGTKQVFFRKRNHSDQPSYVCDYCLGEGRVSFFFFFLVVLSLQSFYSQLGLKC